MSTLLTSQVADLYYSLCEVGREDLALELRERNSEFLERAERNAEGIHP